MGSGTKLMMGGLLAGLGKGMVDEAEAMRQAALERAREMRRQEERQSDREFQTKAREEDRKFQEQRDAAAAKERRGLLGEEYRLRKELEKTKVDGKTDGKGDLSIEDDRLIKTVTERHTTKTIEGEKTDWAAVAATLRKRKRDDLAELVAPAEGSENKVDVSSPEYVEAQRRADAWVESQAGVFSGDSSDFEAQGGNREQARQVKTMEFYRELTGKGGGESGQTTSGAGAPAAVASQPQSGQSGGKPAGGGTRESPFKATSQAHIDWFKANAPAGSVIEVDGKLYTK